MKPPKKLENVAFILKGFIEDLALRSGEKFEITPVEENWESASIFLFAEEQSCREAVDEIVRDASKRKNVARTISPKEEYFLFLRCQCALDFFGMLFPPSGRKCPFLEVRKNTSDADLISWLLIDVWSQRYDHWMKLNMIGKYGSLGFYGLVERDTNDDWM